MAAALFQTHFLLYVFRSDSLPPLYRTVMRLFSPQRAATAMAVAAFVAAAPVTAQLPTPKPPDTVFLEELTWDELAMLIKGGKTTAIIGTAGTEQKGPHMAIGEHKYATTYCADKIARALGNAIVAPIVTYVPEGSWERPTWTHVESGIDHTA